MKSNPKISIIVPVYNAEKYIQRCVNSLLSQTFSDFEIILVDDGSIDNSGVICDEYAQTDSRLYSYHKQNGGVSSARQYGLERAVGEYVIHADPDDWVENDMLEVMYSKAIENNADMVISDYYIDTQNKQRRVNQHISKCDNISLLKATLEQRLHSSCWNKLVRRHLFDQYDIEFPEGLSRWEDMWVTCSLLMHDIKVSYVPEAFYHYDQTVNTNSLVRKVSKNGVESQIRFCEYFDSLLSSGGGEIYNEELLKALDVAKRATKELMFCSRMYSKEELVNTFKEVNAFYEFRKFGIDSVKRYVTYSLSLLLQGHYRFAYIYYDIISFLRSISRKVKNNFKK